MITRPSPWHPPWPATFETAHCDSFVMNWSDLTRAELHFQNSLSCMCPVRVGYKRDSSTLVEGWKRGSSHFAVWVCMCVWPCVHCYWWADVPHWHEVAVGPEIAHFPWVFCQLDSRISGVCLAHKKFLTILFREAQRHKNLTWVSVHPRGICLLILSPLDGLPCGSLQFQLVLIGFYLTIWLFLTLACELQAQQRCRDSHVKTAWVTSCTKVNLYKNMLF